MATFKVGDKARVARGLWKDAAGDVWIGCEVVILAVHRGKRQIPPLVYEAEDVASPGRWGYFMPQELEPILRYPKADEFIERIKKLKPYEEPTVEPKRVPVIAPTAIYNGMTLACTPEGVFALRDGVWTKIEPR